MNAPANPADALIRSVEERSKIRHRELVERGRRAAASATATARKAARERVRRAIHAQRERTNDKVAEARSHLQLRVARWRQENQLDMLRALHPGVERTLLDLWQEPAVQDAWVVSAVARAASCLTERHWRIQHPIAWEPSGPALDAVTRAGATAHWEPEPEIGAGIRIRSADACVDATTDGLLARPSRVDGLLLAQLEEESTGER